MLAVRQTIKEMVIVRYILAVMAGIFILQAASANIYTADVYFTVPDTVYTTNERIEIKGYVYQANYSNNGTLVSASAALANAAVNLSIRNKNGGAISSTYSFTTDSAGTFYSGSNYYPNSTNVTAPNSAGDYYIKAQYTDPNNTAWFSEVEVSVVNQSIDTLNVGADKARYYPSESISIEAEAVRLVGDKILYISNVSVNGTLRNSTKSIIETFNCTTGSNGKCTSSVSAPSTYGDYIIEVNNFKAFSSISVVPFSFSIYMKDELGQSLKNVYALGEQATVEVKITNASDSDSYSFSGYIVDSAGNVVKSITSTTLNSNNSFTNTFLFTVDALTYSYGAYKVSVTVIKSGDGSITGTTSFEVKDWKLTINKKSSDSGFEYEYSTFVNKTLRFEAYPTYRSNGSIIANINSTFFTIRLKDNLNNVITSANTTWNATCGKGGCYEFSIAAPQNTGKYGLYVSLSYSGASQTVSRIINIINTIMSAQSTNADGAIKELFGANEFVYLSISAYNLSTSSFNLTDAEVFSVEYMNGSEISYVQVNSSSLVNATNSAYEWAWNSTSQKLKLDVPKIGGIYNVFIFGNNRTVGALAKFIVNPYETCIVPKDTAGTVSAGYYYVWQFKTTDTVYLEIKATQANNPLGRATAANSTNSSGTYGMGSACNIDTTTKQVVSNATISILEVENIETGAVQSINSSESICQSSDSSGGYSCTVKPLTKWSGGVNLVKLKIQGQDGTTGIAYGRFEARAFYLYGWSQTWQNNPTSNITLNVRLYEAGKGWWGSSGGLSGTISVKRVEYQGSDGEWIWPPVDSGYNITSLNSSTVTSGSGSINLPVTSVPGGVWKTGNYRVVIQGTTSNGDADYGYAWFGIKLWDVYGQPVECTSTGCNYKSYFNSKENITLYIKISKAGSYNYNDNGGADIYGNVTVNVKKIQDCRTWPCKELNTSLYSASTLNLNASSPWYWNANLNNNSRYLLQINTTSGSWGTGYYSVVLNINGTDTGNAWFNTIAFYVDTQPTDENGTNYMYSIRGNRPMYFNISTIKSYKYGYWNGGSWIRYNSSDYMNVTFYDAVLRTWDGLTGQSKEYNYPEDINVTPLSVSGNTLVNISYLNGSWPSGYYSGEITFKNSDNESSTGWLWFEVRPFRVSVSSNNYNIDSDQCINATLNIYEPRWYANSVLNGNYSIQSVYEDVWSGGSRSQTSYTNYTSVSFNGTANINFCPNSGGWGGGSWGGYHYLNIRVRDNVNNDSETGWLSFKAVPFSTSWGVVSGGNNKLTNANVIVPVTVTKPLSGENTTGNITKIYQWRYDNVYNGEQTYIFSVGNCYSNVSGQCTVNGTQNVTIYAPSGGWKVGYNYLYANWVKDSDSSLSVQDWSGIYIEGREAYNGYYSYSDANGNYKYNFATNENLTIKVNIRDSSYNSVNVNITNVQYAYSGSSCWDEWCRTYTDATWSLASGGVQTSSGNAILQIKVPSGGWSRGYYYIKTTVSGSGGTATITGGSVRVKDSTAPNITINSPVNNQTITSSSFLMNITTTESAQCNFYVANYDNFNSWYCGGVLTANSSNGTTYTSQTRGACNTTLYNYNGSSYYTEYASSNYHSTYNGATSTWYSGSTGMITGGTYHAYTFDTTNWSTQHYGIQAWCYDNEDNYVKELVSIKVNITQNELTSAPLVTINSPLNNRYYSPSNLVFNFTLNKNGSCAYTLNNGGYNYTTSTVDNRIFNATNSSIADGTYLMYAYCNDTYGNKNYTTGNIFVIDTIPPVVTIYSLTNNGINLSVSNVTLNVTLNENSSCLYTLNNGINNYSMSGLDNRTFNATNYSIADGTYTAKYYCNDSAGNWNRTAFEIFGIDTTKPQISYGTGTQNDSLSINATSIYVNVSLTETNFANITFLLWNTTGQVNSTIYTTRTYFINWTGLGYTNYSYNVSIRDNANNFNSTAKRYINLTVI